MLRMLLLALPQGWVLYTALRFHETVLSTIGTGLDGSQFGLLSDAVIVLLSGWLVLVANLLIAAVLLMLALWATDREHRGRADGSPRSHARWTCRRTASAASAAMGTGLLPFGDGVSRTHPPRDRSTGPVTDRPPWMSPHS